MQLFFGVFFVKSYQKVAEAAVQVVFQQKQDIFFEFTMQYEATACVYGGNMCVCVCVCTASLLAESYFVSVEKVWDGMSGLCLTEHVCACVGGECV